MYFLQFTHVCFPILETMNKITSRITNVFHQAISHGPLLLIIKVLLTLAHKASTTHTPKIKEKADSTRKQSHTATLYSP